MSPKTLRDLCAHYQALIRDETGSPIPSDPLEQLRSAVEAVFRSWNGARAIAYRERERISHDLGTAVNVQAMVFGNRDDNSGTGVGFTRNPATGDDRPYGDFLVNAQGEDVVAGIRNTEDLDAMRGHFPQAHDELIETLERLEEHYRDMCDTEFTIEQGKLWMLQTRIGKRTGAAALRMAVDMTRGSRWSISTDEALLRITEDHLDQLLHPDFAHEPAADEVLTHGLPASPGAAVGHVYFTAADAVAAANRGEKVILVRNETSPDDIDGILAAQGLLTTHGGLVSHAAVVARGWGKPAVVGAEHVRIAGDHFTVNDVVVNQGDLISISGSAGFVALGELPVTPPKASTYLDQILEWADEIRRGRLGVRANADNAEDAEHARVLGAEGIGLCRTEHMFLGADRLPIARRMILADTPAEEQAALEELRTVQKADFVKILEAMDGLPVTVRLLDPPLHEFLPSVEELAVKAATTTLTADEQKSYEMASAWREVNPMLGTRGVRLGVVKPGLYAMQVRALVEAALERAKAGGNPVIEIMIPLTIAREELALARRWCQESIDEVQTETNAPLDIKIGTMIETPRACLRAADLAHEADFFSFGTNDLTQMTLGFSRDDVEGRMMDAYLSQGLLPHNPFDTIDVDGVGEMVRIGVTRGRQTKPDLKLGICGEHGGDPESIALFYDAGLDYVSCSPYRVPVARLAAAQAILRARANNR